MTFRRLPALFLLPALLCAAPPDFLSLQHQASQGNPAAMTALGEIFFDGRGVAKDEFQAAGWFRQAAEKGFAPAQARLGWMLWKGRGTVRDPFEADLWLRRAVAQGEAAGQQTLADLIKEDPDRERALDRQALSARFRAAADKRTFRSTLSPPSISDRPHEFSGGMEEAKWYFRAAESGVPKALRNLGLMYVTGEGVKKDPAEGFRRLKEAADKKDVEAQWAVGILFLEGRGTAKDDAQALAWLGKAAAAGDLYAQRALGWMAETGRGGPVRLKDAAKFYKQAADGGDAWARTALGRMTEEGRGVAAKAGDALALYEAASPFPPALVDAGLLREARGEFLPAHTAFGKAAEAGDAAGRYHLGVLFELGRGGRRDWDEAGRLYDGAAFSGVMDAQARRARLLEASPTPDAAKALALYKEAAAQGSPLAALAAGLMRWEGRGAARDGAAARTFWEPLAKAGDPLAAYWLGRAGEKEGGESVSLYKVAAQGGDVRAQARLGVLLKETPAEANAWLVKAATGGDVLSAVTLARRAAGTKDESAALLQAARLGDRASQSAYARRRLQEDASADAARWFRMAAAQNDGPAANALAQLYLAGDGVPLDPSEAVRWLSRAADAGHAASQRDLGLLYERGLGVPKDPAKAAAFLKKAAAAGDEIAKKKAPR